jgi:hypothetical protein
MINHYLCFSGFFNNTMGFCWRYCICIQCILSNFTPLLYSHITLPSYPHFKNNIWWVPLCYLHTDVSNILCFSSQSLPCHFPFTSHWPLPNTVPFALKSNKVLVLWGILKELLLILLWVASIPYHKDV